jgi:hypothetical protein
MHRTKWAHLWETSSRCADFIGGNSLREFPRTTPFARRQKAWFLPAAPVQGAFGASAGISADNAIRPPAKSVVFAGCAGAGRLRRVSGNFRGQRHSPAGKKRGFCRLRRCTAPSARQREFPRTMPLARRQKAWFLPAASVHGAFGASTGISADNATHPPAKGATFAGCAT